MARIRPVRAMVFLLQAAANLSLAKARAFDVNVWSAKKLPVGPAILKLIMRSVEVAVCVNYFQ